MNKIYIAGKLSHDDAVGYIQNCNRMIVTAKLVRDNGYAVYVPCNDFLEGIVNGDFTYEDYFENSQPWLLSSDGVFLTPGWETSPGTKREMQLAIEHDIPVFDDIDNMNKHFNS